MNRMADRRGLMDSGLKESRLKMRGLLAVLAVASWTAAAVNAQSPDWPAKPVTIIVPSAAGGAADFVARTFAKYLSAEVPGAVTLVDDKPGAGGIVGTEAAKNAAPDGHTFLLSTNSTHAANVSLYRNLRYDPQSDFAPVGMFGTFGAVLIVPRDSAFQTVSDLVARAQAAPGALSYGYYSSSSQVPAELLRARAAVEYTGASYRNITQIMTDLAGQQLHFAFVDALSAAPALQSDRLRPIAVTTPARLESLPGVPTVAETYPGFEMQGWLGLTAPAGTPQAIVDRVSDLVMKASADPEVRQALAGRGLNVEPMPAAKLKNFIAEDIARWASWVATAGIQPQ